MNREGKMNQYCKFSAKYFELDQAVPGAANG